MRQPQGAATCAAVRACVLCKHGRVHTVFDTFSTSIDESMHTQAAQGCGQRPYSPYFVGIIRVAGRYQTYLDILSA
jgi:hypothetical protein